MQLFHIATVSDWEAAQHSGFYTTSTVGRSLQDEGFLHASRADQWEGVRHRYYEGVTEPLVLLVIDSDRLTAPWREEPVGNDTYPHIYGPLNPDAVATTIPLSVATPASAPAIPAASTTPAPTSGESFAQVFFGEMFYRMGLTILVFSLMFGGAQLARAINEDVPLIGAGIGLAAGLAIAWLIHRRRTA